MGTPLSVSIWHVLAETDFLYLRDPGDALVASL